MLEMDCTLHFAKSRAIQRVSAAGLQTEGQLQLFPPECKLQPVQLANSNTCKAKVQPPDLLPTVHPPIRMSFAGGNPKTFPHSTVASAAKIQKMATESGSGLTSTALATTSGQPMSHQVRSRLIITPAISQSLSEAVSPSSSSAMTANTKVGPPKAPKMNYQKALPASAVKTCVPGSQDIVNSIKEPPAKRQKLPAAPKDIFALASEGKLDRTSVAELKAWLTAHGVTVWRVIDYCFFMS